MGNKKRIQTFWEDYQCVNDLNFGTYTQSVQALVPSMGSPERLWNPSSHLFNEYWGFFSPQ
jgi:hypothetical protein